MNYWIVPSNEEHFHLQEMLEINESVDWKQLNNFEVGDIVFIYNSKPWHKITHKLYVERVNIPTAEFNDNKEYWSDLREYENGRRHNRYARFRLIVRAPDDCLLDLDSLRKNGLKGDIQSVMKIENSKLSYFIRKKFQPETDEKIARICWNTNSWERPSGREGKSTGDNFEGKNGFGHEEWLLDRRKIYIDGFHYAFIEPLRGDTFKGSVFDGVRKIHLYTYSPRHKCQYIGYINNAEYVPPELAEEVWTYYEKCGWASSMKKELAECGIKINGKFLEHFNIRFKFEDFTNLIDKQLYLRKDDPNTVNKHYVLINRREPFLFENSIVFMDNDPEEIYDPNNRISEGVKMRVTVNRYERSPEARRACLEAKGYRCAVCGMDFESTYGEMGRDFIHVHHVVPIADVGKEYIVDPIKDLVPVCPNCHAMLHRGKNGNVLSVDELKKLYKGLHAKK